eukprot:437167_1
MGNKNSNVYDCLVSANDYKVTGDIGRGKRTKSRIYRVEEQSTKDSKAMKEFPKAELLKDKDMYRSMWVERRVMAEVESQFTLSLFHCFQNDTACFMVIQSVDGGSMRRYLEQKGYMHEKRARFYLAQIVLGLEALHAKQIVYRALRPENIMLDEAGNARIINFGDSTRAHRAEDKMLFGGVGPDSYQAPEMLLRKKYSYSVDIWALGILMVELLTEKRPFRPGEPGRDPHTDKIRMLEQEKRKFTRPCLSLVSKLLTKDPAKRIGCGKRGFREIKKHKFFRKIDWKALEAGDTKPPYQPKMEKLRTEESINALKFQQNDRANESITAEEQILFKDWNMSVPTNDPDAAYAQDTPHNTVVDARESLMSNGGVSSDAHMADPQNQMPSDANELRFSAYNRDSFSDLELLDLNDPDSIHDEFFDSPALSDNDEVNPAEMIELVEREIETDSTTTGRTSSDFTDPKQFL